MNDELIISAVIGALRKTANDIEEGLEAFKNGDTETLTVAEVRQGIFKGKSKHE